jgi:hypothetical protein
LIFEGLGFFVVTLFADPLNAAGFSVTSSNLSHSVSHLVHAIHVGQGVLAMLAAFGLWFVCDTSRLFLSRN